MPGEVLQRVMETATWAPNAHNRQPWRFVQLASPESRQKLSAAMNAQFEKALGAEGANAEERDLKIKRSRDRVLEAPEAILLCLDTKILDSYQDENRAHGEYLMGVQSVALAGGQMLLAAHAEGLAGVWMCAPLFAPAEVGQALGLPPSWQAQGLILLGYPAKAAEARSRLSFTEVSKKL